MSCFSWPSSALKKKSKFEFLQFSVDRVQYGSLRIPAFRFISPSFMGLLNEAQLANKKYPGLKKEFDEDDNGPIDQMTKLKANKI